MAVTVAKMTKNELKEIIESTVEKKLLQLLGDPDEGLALKKLLEAACGANEGRWQRANEESRCRQSSNG